MSNQALPIYGLELVLIDRFVTATYYREDDTKQYYELAKADSSSRLAERLAPVAASWGGELRITPEGETYIVIGVGSEATSDDIYVICWLQDKSNLDMRCWPLNEFERLAVPTDQTSAA
jgi:hypothetical protein